jgi:hypothetical protein
MSNLKKIFLLLLLVVFASGWSPIQMLPAFNNLRSDITGQLSEMFGREITVSSVSGTLVNQIELNDVSIAKEKKLFEGSIIKAKKIVIDYNPFVLAANKGNIAPAISKIVIIEPEILVERSIHDEWNMAKLIPMSKPSGKKSQAKPMMFSGKVLIQGGFGLYVDHMGWGEDLKGRAFTTQIKDLNAEAKLSGNKIEVSGTATSVIGKAVAYTKTVGTLNIKTGKYRFVVNAKNVDLEKWGYYTMNIPHFKPLSGISDMKLTMTNPPPRKKGLPIFFDGQFNVKAGKAIIFDHPFEGLNGFVWIHDEDARFKNVEGYTGGVPVIANGRIYDFTVANYDIKLDLPRTDIGKLRGAFPGMGKIDLSGKAAASVNIGGDFAHPLFNGSAEVDGRLFGQNMSGAFNFKSDGPVLKVSSDRLSAYGGDLSAESVFDFTPIDPSFNVNVYGVGIDPGKAVPVLSSSKGKAAMNVLVKGSSQKFTVDGQAKISGSGEASVFGTVEAGNIDLSLACKGLGISYGRFKGELDSLNGKISGNLKNDPEKNVVFEGNAVLSNAFFESQLISEAEMAFKYNDHQIDIPSLVLRSGSSTFTVKGRTGPNLVTELSIETVSAEASDLKILEDYLPKEWAPVSGKLDLSVSASGEIKNAEKIDPRNISVSGKCALRNGSVSYQDIKEADLDFSWKNSRLTLQNSRISTEASDVSMNGFVEPGGNIAMDISGKLSLSNLTPVTQKYGRLFGSAQGTCHLEGRTNDPKVAADLDVSNLRFNEIVIDRASGKILYDGKQFSFESPLNIHQADDEYKISGNFSFAKKPMLSLRLDILKGDLGTASTLIDEIRSEIGAKQLFGISEQKMLVIYPEKFQFPRKEFSRIYKSDESTTIIEDISKAEKESLLYGRSIKERSGRNVQGKFSGFLEVKGRTDDLSGELSFKVLGGTWESYDFDEIGADAGLKSGTIEISSVYIKKGNGLLFAHGSINPLTTASLEINAINMPIDFLSLFIGRGKSFNGNFNMDARVRGPVQSLTGSASIDAHSVNIGGVDLDRLSSKMNFSNNALIFDGTELETSGKKAVISGRLPLAGSGISLDITMEGGSIGLLSLASPDIKWISGTGEGFVRITGSTDHPKFNGAVSLKDAEVELIPMRSSLSSVNSEIKINNDVISTEGLSAKWSGKWTQNIINKIKLYGSLDLNGLFAKERSLGLDLKLNDGDFTVDIPAIYKGDVEVKGLSLTGPLVLAQESAKGPKLSGTVNLSNGAISLPDMSKKSPSFPIDLDLHLNILKNSYVTAGDVSNLLSTDFSNLMLNLELEGQNISIKDALSAPNITGKVTFKSGTVNILNREFSLMSEDTQKDTFPAGMADVQVNTADFRGKTLPYLTLTAQINVNSTEKNVATLSSKTPTYTTSNILVISRITGVPFSQEKDEGLNLVFYSFKEDATKQPPELTPTGYDEEQVKVLLLPDFIKGSLGISDVSNVDANEVLSDYLNSRLNAYLLRDVERNLAKSFELESLTLEYNFGKDLRNMFSTNNPAQLGPQEMPETMYGIGAQKSFFDKFYIDAKYSQAVEQSNLINKEFLDYQITYKLNPIFSIVYYREPYSFLQDDTDYYKVTIKAGYEL